MMLRERWLARVVRIKAVCEAPESYSSPCRFGKFVHLKRSFEACRKRQGHTDVDWNQDPRSITKPAADAAAATVDPSEVSGTKRRKIDDVREEVQGMSKQVQETQGMEVVQAQGVVSEEETQREEAQVLEREACIDQERSELDSALMAESATIERNSELDAALMAEGGAVEQCASNPEEETHEGVDVDLAAEVVSEGGNAADAAAADMFLSIPADEMEVTAPTVSESAHLRFEEAKDGVEHAVAVLTTAKVGVMSAVPLLKTSILRNREDSKVLRGGGSSPTQDGEANTARQLFPSTMRSPVKLGQNKAHTTATGTFASFRGTSRAKNLLAKAGGFASSSPSTAPAPVSVATEDTLEGAVGVEEQEGIMTVDAHGRGGDGVALGTSPPEKKKRVHWKMAPVAFEYPERPAVSAYAAQMAAALAGRAPAVETVQHQEEREEAQLEFPDEVQGDEEGRREGDDGDGRAQGMAPSGEHVEQRFDKTGNDAAVSGAEKIAVDSAAAETPSVEQGNNSSQAVVYQADAPQVNGTPQAEAQKCGMQPVTGVSEGSQEATEGAHDSILSPHKKGECESGSDLVPATPPTALKAPSTAAADACPPKGWSGGVALDSSRGGSLGEAMSDADKASAMARRYEAMQANFRVPRFSLPPSLPPSQPPSFPLSLFLPSFFPLSDSTSYTLTLSLVFKLHIYIL